MPTPAEQVARIPLEKPGRPGASALAVGAVAALYLSIFGTTIHGRGDEGLLLEGAERILRGQVPYRDFFSELAPGSFYIQGLWFQLFGIHVWSVRIPMLLVLGTIAGEMFYLARKLMPAWVATIPVLIYVTTAFTRWVLASHHWYSLVFALGAVIALVHWLERRRAGAAAAAGALTACSALCMQSKGALLLAAAILFLGWRSRRSPDTRGARLGLGAYLAGAAAAALPGIAYLGWRGALSAMVDDTFVYVLGSYLPAEFHPLPYWPVNLLRAWSETVGEATLASIAKFAAPVVWSLLVPAFAVVWALRERRRAVRLGSGTEAPVLYLAAAVALLASEMHRFDFVHMLFGAPLLLVLAVTMLDGARRRARPAVRAAAQIALAAVALFHLGQAVVLGAREVRRSQPIQTRRGTFYQLPEEARRYQEVVDAIASRVPAGGEILIYPYDAMLYFLTATSNPTRFDYLLPGSTTPSQFEEVIALVQQRRAPRLIVSFWKERKETMPRLFPRVPREAWREHPLESFLAGAGSTHRPVAEGPGFTLFASGGGQ